MVDNLKTADTQKNETWHELLEILLAEESDVDDVAYAASWLSLNFFTLNQKARNALTERLSKPSEFLPINILEAIECLFDEDRETELILLIQLLQYMPDTYKQIMHILWNPKLSSSYRTSRILLTDEVLTMLDDEAWSDQPN